MNNAYDKTMDIIAYEIYMELSCAKACQRARKRTLNPIRKLRFYIYEKQYMNHVVGIELVKHKLEKVMKEP